MYTSVDAWREQVRQALVPLDIRPARPEPFRAGLSMGRVGDWLLTDIRADAQEAVRTRSLAAADGTRFVKAALLLAGRGRLEQGGRVAALSPGDIALYTTDRPYLFGLDRTFRLAVFMLDAGSCAHRLRGVDDVTAVTVPAGSGSGRLTGALLRAMLAGDPAAMPGASTPAMAAPYVGGAVLDLVDGVVADLRGQAVPEAAGRTAVLHRALRFIDNHLTDRELGPPVVAAALGISVSYLHQLFHDAGRSVQATVRHRRLESARRDLADVRLRGRTVSAIAAGWGFADESHFLRVFRDAYGETPGEYRRRVAAAGARADNNL
jgi:AraC-like DNA-binding protein